jgi:hypothetical protein
MGRDELRRRRVKADLRTEEPDGQRHFHFFVKTRFLLLYCDPFHLGHAIEETPICLQFPS